jgi:hypothetical protein
MNPNKTPSGRSQSIEPEKQALRPRRAVEAYLTAQENRMVHLTDEGVRYPESLARKHNVPQPAFPSIVRLVATQYYTRLPVSTYEYTEKGREAFLRAVATNHTVWLNESFVSVVQDTQMFLQKALVAGYCANDFAYDRAHPSFRDVESRAAQATRDLGLPLDVASYVRGPIELKDPMRQVNLSATLENRPPRDLVAMQREFFWGLSVNLSQTVNAVLKNGVDENWFGVHTYSAQTATASFSYYDREMMSPTQRVCTRHYNELINARSIPVEEAASQGCHLPGFVRDVVDSVSWLGALCQVVDGEQSYTEKHTISEETDVSRPKEPSSLGILRRHMSPFIDPALVLGEFVLIGWNGAEASREHARRHQTVARRHEDRSDREEASSRDFRSWLSNALRVLFVTIPMCLLLVLACCVLVMCVLFLVVGFFTEYTAFTMYVLGVTAFAAGIAIMWTRRLGLDWIAI